jgi:hypothetical protein
MFYILPGKAPSIPDSWTISPLTASVEPGKSINVSCNTEVDLESCHFIIHDGSRLNGPIMDFSLGDDSPEFNGSLEEKLFFKAKYRGIGSTKSSPGNSCGITLQVLSGWKEFYILGCRGRKKAGSWMYTYMSFRVADNSTGRLFLHFTIYFLKDTFSFIFYAFL